jgi:threonine dehydratase
MAKECIDDILVVSETTIRRATSYLLTEEKVVAEPSGAIGVAALMENPEYFRGKQVAIIITGGNLDGSLMRELLS